MATSTSSHRDLATHSQPIRSNSSWCWSLYDEQRVERRSETIFHQFHRFIPPRKFVPSHLCPDCSGFYLQLWRLVHSFCVPNKLGLQQRFSILQPYCRVKKLKGQFARLYIVVALQTRDQNDFFVRSYSKHEMELGKPPFVQVLDLEMGFEKIVKIAHSRGACKRQDATSQLKAERKQAVQGMDIFLKVVTSIPGIDNHDAHALNQAIGSIEVIAKASTEYILENTDLSVEKANIISQLFRDLPQP